MSNLNLNGLVPTIKCPHCDKINHPIISGWGGELSTRTKACKFCKLEYRLITYSFADTNIGETTCLINLKKSRIEFLKERIHKTLNKIIDKEYEWAKEYLRIEQSSGGKQN
jgi:phage FluMu protein Com